MLFKILHGDESHISTDITPFHEGYCYVTHQGYMYVDMNIGTKDTPNNQRIKLNAQNCETLMGLSLDALRNEISTQDAVVLSEAQSYTDQAFEAATTQDAVILAEAQAYTDEALAGAQLSVDDAPTEGSTNPVSSGGVYEALQNIPTGAEGVVDPQADTIALRDSDGRLHAAGINTQHDDLYNYPDTLVTGLDVYAAFSNHPVKLDSLSQLMSTFGDSSFIPVASEGGWSDASFGEDVNGYNIVQRDMNGNIKVPEIPDSDDFAASKKYVDTKLEELKTYMEQLILGGEW